MEKSKILAVGCGGCGCNQLDVLLGLDKRYTGMYVNTNLSEMESLTHFDRKRRCFYIANADGTGKDRSLAEQYMKEEAPKFAEIVQRFINQDTVYFFASMNGGTGSKAIILLSLMTKKLCPEKSLNIIATFPSLTESQLDFENAISTWNELIKLQQKGVIDSIQFIDNDKGTSEDEINLKAMKDFDRGFEVIGGKLDTSDAKKAHCATGYKVILNLDNKIKDIKDAIDTAMKSSVFYMPEKFSCQEMIGSIHKEKIEVDGREIKTEADFNVKSIKENFEVYGVSKFNVSENGNNVLILGGCDIPKEAIELTEEALKNSKSKQNNRVSQSNLLIKNIAQNKNNDNKEKEESPNNSKLSSKDLNDMFNDDDFWNL